ncbi:MAG: threonylcarbamoyl-AMP synthase [Alphaproteobacteria bacterium PRO2]|nr:threonylcarbamoyl-AMP synthase [Alphaproteobacteria bacterium PRO2]
MLVSATDENIAKAAEILKSGGVVAMPTETVYGLAGNAFDGRAVAKIFEVKGRPQFNPLIAHFADGADVESCAVMNEKARALAQAFWPGPLTMVLPRAKGCPVSELASAGLETIAVRVPNHPVARKLIKACGFPLVAPSANLSGTVSPTSPAHVSESLGDKVNMILAAGSSSVGLESTVVDLSEDKVFILRPGAVMAEDIEQVLGERVSYESGDALSPKSPGLLLKHYAPKIPLRLNAIDLNPGEALLGFSSLKFMGIKGGGAAMSLPESMRRNLSEEGDLHQAAANLFAMLRELDRTEHKGIAVMPVPDVGLGVAINDRLKRAAS